MNGVQFSELLSTKVGALQVDQTLDEPNLVEILRICHEKAGETLRVTTRHQIIDMLLSGYAYCFHVFSK